MSRSIKKSPAHGWSCAESEKWDKRDWHGRFRAMTRLSLASCPDPDSAVFPHVREASDPWCFAKDGHAWHGRRRRVADLLRRCGKDDIPRLKRLFGK